MSHEDLLEKAKISIGELYSDTSVEPEIVRQSLESLSRNVNFCLEMLGAEEKTHDAILLDEIFSDED